MNSRKLTLAALGILFLVASNIVAQEQNTQRRERLRNAAEAAAGIAVKVAEEANQAEAFTGNVIILQGKPAAEAKTINVGGLLIVRIPDSGSRPPQNIAVHAGQQYKRLGQLRGVREQQGKPLMGGGFSWVLLKPVNEGEGAVTVTFVPNGGDSAPVKHIYNVNVTAAEAG